MMAEGLLVQMTTLVRLPSPILKTIVVAVVLESG